MEHDEIQSTWTEPVAQASTRRQHYITTPHQIHLDAVEGEITCVNTNQDTTQRSLTASANGQTYTEGGIVPTDQETVAEDHVLPTESPQNQNSERGSIKKHKQPPRILRYRKRAFYLFLLYLPFLVIPWVLICVLAVRPLGEVSYVDQSGGLSPDKLLGIYGWVAFIRVVNAIAGVATIPITSALLAQAAIVFGEKRKESQKLSIKQLFVLADRDWNNLLTLWEIMKSDKEGNSSPFLWRAAALIAVSAIQPPVQQALVTYESYPIMSCLDLPYIGCGPVDSAIVQGYDPEPGDLARLPQSVVIQNMRAQLATVTEFTGQPMLWSEISFDTGTSFADADIKYPALAGTFEFYYLPGQARPGFFVSALKSGITTGVVRQHAMRMNSTVTCEFIPRLNFPSSCTGSRPFTSSFVYDGVIEIRVCAPGEYGVFPWALSRNRQDISEELYIDVYVPSGTLSGPVDWTNFTVHCSAGTTRGYFELGNWRNNYTYGPLINEWPTQQEAEADWNDYRNRNYNFAPASENDTTATNTIIFWSQPPGSLETYDLLTSGPLMSTAIALFGNSSFFDQAANSTNSNSSALSQICQQNNIPYSRFSTLSTSDSDLLNDCLYSSVAESNLNVGDLIRDWVMKFNSSLSPYGAEELLEIGMFFANQALLTETSDASLTAVYEAREIYNSPGTVIIKPVKTIAGTVIVSFLILVQLSGLLYTIWYIYQIPTWTAGYDAVAIAQIGAALTASKISPIGPLTEESLAALKRTSGLIGLVQHEEQSVRQDTEANSTTEQQPKTSPEVLVQDVNGTPNVDELRTRTEVVPQQAESDITVATLPDESSMVKLSLDGPGLITHDMAPAFWLRKRKWKWKWKREKTQDTQV